jgi:hypothetical protein
MRTTMVRDPATGLPIIRRVQDVDAILDQNKRDQAAFDRSRVARNRAGVRQIGRIPMVVMAQLREMGIVKGMTVTDPVRFLKFMSDSQVRHLRTDDGRRLA